GSWVCTGEGDTGVTIREPSCTAWMNAWMPASSSPCSARTRGVAEDTCQSGQQRGRGDEAVRLLQEQEKHLPRGASLARRHASQDVAVEEAHQSFPGRTWSIASSMAASISSSAMACSCA